MPDANARHKCAHDSVEMRRQWVGEGEKAEGTVVDAPWCGSVLDNTWCLCLVYNISSIVQSWIV